jgi:hypothetical protein
VQLTGTSVVRDVVEDKLRRLIGEPVVDKDGDFVVRRDGDTIWIRIMALQPDVTLVMLFAFVAGDVAQPDRASRFLAAKSLDMPMCHFELHGGRHIVASHSLLGEFLSTGELKAALDSVGAAVREYGPQVRQRFGGSPVPGTDPEGPRATDVQDLLAGRLDGMHPERRRRQGLARLVGGLVGVLAVVLAWVVYGTTGSWWLTAYALIATGLTALLIGASIVDPAPGMALGIVACLAGSSVAVLLVAWWLWDTWWLAVVLASVVGPLLGLLILAPFVSKDAATGRGSAS